MRSGNYCKVCGHRILPNEPYCTGCGAKTGFDASNIDCVLTPPIHNIGFFNFQIDFSPYIITKNDFKYEICSCGYLNDKNNEFCYMCGAKRSESKLAKILKRKSKPKPKPLSAVFLSRATKLLVNVFIQANQAHSA